MDFDKQKQYLDNRNALLNLSDAELINEIIVDNLYLGVIFEKYKDEFPRKLRTIYNNIDIHTIEDIFIESVCDLKDKILTKGIELLEDKKFSIAGYLMGICKNKVRNEIKNHSSLVINTDFDNQDNGDEFSETFSDQIQDQDQDEEFMMQREVIDEQTRIQSNILEIMKNKGGKCYSLIVLSMSSKYNYTTPDLTKLFKFKNDNTTNNQKYKCIIRLKRMYNNFQLA